MSRYIEEILLTQSGYKSKLMKLNAKKVMSGIRKMPTEAEVKQAVRQSTSETKKVSE